MDIRKYIEQGIPIPIGVSGENKIEHYEFGYGDWVSLYGDGVISFNHQRPGDANPYPCVLKCEDNIATWEITATDTQFGGQGRIQVVYMVNDVVKKTMIGMTMIESSLGENVAATDPIASYIDTMVDLKNDTYQYKLEAKASADTASQKAQDVLGLTAEASINNAVGIPSVGVSVTQDGDHKKMSFSFENLKGDPGRDYGEVFIIPQMYGVKGDGVTDDTEALNALYDVAWESGDTVVFPEGTYIISDTVKVTSNYYMSSNATFKVVSDEAIERAIIFSPVAEPTRGTGGGQCYINLDGNRKCNYGISSGVVARKTLNLKVKNALVCGFDDNYVGNSNAENIINVFVTNDRRTDITTYGVITTADNYYDVITTVNCTYAVKSAVIGCYINYVHAWAWGEALTVIGDSSCILLNGGSMIVNYVYQDTIKYGAYIDGATGGRINIKTLVENTTNSYTIYVYGVGEKSGQCEVSIEGFFSFLGGHVFNYELYNGVIFKFKGMTVNNSTNFPVPSNNLNNLPDEGVFYIRTDSETTGVPTGLATGGWTVLCYCESYKRVQLLINGTLMYMRVGRVDNRTFESWQSVLYHKKNALSSWTSVAGNSSVDVTFSTVYSDLTNWQCQVYGGSDLVPSIVSISDTQVVVRVHNHSVNQVSFRLYLHGE